MPAKRTPATRQSTRRSRGDEAATQEEPSESQAAEAQGETAAGARSQDDPKPPPADGDLPVTAVGVGAEVDVATDPTAALKAPEVVAAWSRPPEDVDMTGLQTLSEDVKANAPVPEPQDDAAGATEIAKSAHPEMRPIIAQTVVDAHETAIGEGTVQHAIQNEKRTDRQEDGTALADSASETIYVRNINEHVKLPVLRKTLYNLFTNFGRVLAVTAHSNKRMRGQAFVTFASKSAPERALLEAQGFPLYGKAITIQYAKENSEVAVKRKLKKTLGLGLAQVEKSDEWTRYKEQRLLQKKKSRRMNPLRRKEIARLKAREDKAGDAIEEPASKRIVQLPDEYLPPNKTLFLQNLPAAADRDALTALFQVYAGLLDVRMVPGMSGIAFVEYVDESAATVAREALHNHRLPDTENPDGVKMKVTFARK